MGLGLGLGLLCLMRRSRRLLLVLGRGSRIVGLAICRLGSRCRTGLRHAIVQGTGNRKVLLCRHLRIALGSLGSL